MAFDMQLFDASAYDSSYARSWGRKHPSPSFSEADKRIKGLCGAKPPQKPRWTNAVGWEAIERYADFTRDAW